MSDAAVLEAVFVLNPRTGQRAQRLAVAIGLLRSGVDRRSATVMIRHRFGLCRSAAWRVVEIAADIAEAPAAEPAEADR